MLDLFATPTAEPLPIIVVTVMADPANTDFIICESDTDARALPPGDTFSFAYVPGEWSVWSVTGEQRYSIEHDLLPAT